MFRRPNSKLVLSVLKASKPELKITNEDIVLNDFDVIDEPVITFPELNKDEIEIEFDLFE